jgi:hypothetical protein
LEAFIDDQLAEHDKRPEQKRGRQHGIEGELPDILSRPIHHAIVDVIEAMEDRVPCRQPAL